MKLIFLDVDGVLNTPSIRVLRKAPGTEIGKAHMALVAKVVNATGCKIVLTTAWRRSEVLVEKIKEFAAQAGIKDDIVGQTADLPGEPLGAEIREWLQRHPEVTRYAVADDDEDAGIFHEGNFFNTNFIEGLTEAIADKMIAHLTT